MPIPFKRTRRAPNEFGERLSALIKEKGLTRAQFGARCGISAPSLTGYLRHRGAHVPSSTVVVRIAREFNVSCDWLLLGVGGPAPRYRSAVTESVSKASVASALSAYVATAVSERVRREPPVEGERYDQWRADGVALLDEIVDLVYEWFREWRVWKRAEADLQSLRVLADGPLPPEIAARLSDDTRKALAKAVSEWRSQPLDPHIAARVIRTPTT